MILNDLKVTQEDFKGKNIQSITENTVVGRAEELKRLFDAPAQEVMAEKFNGLIELLNSEEYVGLLRVPELEAGMGSDLAAQLAYLLDAVKEATLEKPGFNPVRYDVEQNVSAEQKQRALRNIGAVPDTRTINGKKLDQDVNLSMEDIPDGVLRVSQGGTGSGSPHIARQNINMIGINPITLPEEDTVLNWKNFGTGVACFDRTGMLTDKPSEDGMLLNVSYTIEGDWGSVVQIYVTNEEEPRLLLRAGHSPHTGWLNTWRELTPGGGTDVAQGTYGGYRTDDSGNAYYDVPVIEVDEKGAIVGITESVITQADSKTAGFMSGELYRHVTNSGGMICPTHVSFADDESNEIHLSNCEYGGVGQMGGTAYVYVPSVIAVYGYDTSRSGTRLVPITDYAIGLVNSYPRVDITPDERFKGDDGAYHYVILYHKIFRASSGM